MTLPEGATRRTEHVMGTAVVVDVPSGQLPPEAVAEAVDEVFAWLRWVDDTFSTYKPESQIRRLDAGELVVTECHPRVGDVLRRCADLRRATSGYFDVRAAPDQSLDPSGFVKGWAVQEAAALLSAHGLAHYSINAGGDVAVAGRPTPSRRWRVGIVHPQDHLALSAVVEVSDCAVATSGTYERGLHVFNPHTGEPATQLVSATVIGADLGVADAYATAALAMGTAASCWLEGQAAAGYDSYLIDAGGFVWSSPGFDAHRAGLG